MNGGGTKKDETRFTIRFNPADPRHQRAMEALEAAGRRKASLIADALCEYLTRYEADGSAVTVPQSNQTSSSESLKPIHMETKGERPIAPVIQEAVDESAFAEESPFDDDMRQAVLGGLSMFMK